MSGILGQFDQDAAPNNIFELLVLELRALIFPDLVHSQTLSFAMPWPLLAIHASRLQVLGRGAPAAIERLHDVAGVVAVPAARQSNVFTLLYARGEPPSQHRHAHRLLPA